MREFFERLLQEVPLRKSDIERVRLLTLLPRLSLSKTAVRILHLSDLCFTEAGPDPTYQTLVPVIQALVLTGQVPHLIAITGDIAFSGQRKEYREAEAWLHKLLNGCGDPPVLMVPGDHDFLRSPSPDRYLWEPPVKAGDAAKIEEFLSGKRLADQWFPFEQWRNSARLLVSPADCGAVLLEINGLKLHFALLHSAWFAPAGSGQQWAGQYLARAALARPPEACLTVALMHHSPETLHEVERPGIEDLLKGAHVRLCGDQKPGKIHLHGGSLSSAVGKGSATKLLLDPRPRPGGESAICGEGRPLVLCGRSLRPPAQPGPSARASTPHPFSGSTHFPAPLRYFCSLPFPSAALFGTVHHAPDPHFFHSIDVDTVQKLTSPSSPPSPQAPFQQKKSPFSGSAPPRPPPALHRSPWRKSGGVRPPHSRRGCPCPSAF